METAKFGREMEGRKVRLVYADGSTDVGVVVSAPAHDDCKGCDGFVYDLVSTDRADRYEAMNVRIGSALWARFEDLRSYEVVEN